MVVGWLVRTAARVQQRLDGSAVYELVPGEDAELGKEMLNGASNADDDSDEAPATQPPPLRQEAQNSTVALVVVFYFVVSIALVCLNKYVMSHMPFKFPFPLFLTFVQLVIAFALMAFFSACDIRVLMVKYPRVRLQPSLALRLLPTAVVYVGMMASNNICLRYANVAYYQVARSLTILFTIALSFFLHGTRTSLKAVFACAVVMLGFGIGSWGEGEFTWAALSAGVLSSFFVALNSIFIKSALAVVDDDEGVMMLYNTVIASVLMLMLSVASGEAREVWEFPYFHEPIVWISVALTGVFGFLINLGIVLVVKLTSPLTNNIAGTAKACVQTLLAVVLFGTHVGVVNGCGLLLCIFGSAWYSWIRLKEKESAKVASEVPAR